MAHDGGGEGSPEAAGEVGGGEGFGGPLIAGADEVIVAAGAVEGFAGGVAVEDELLGTAAGALFCGIFDEGGEAADLVRGCFEATAVGEEVGGIVDSGDGEGGGVHAEGGTGGDFCGEVLPFGDAFEEFAVAPADHETAGSGGACGEAEEGCEVVACAGGGEDDAGVHAVGDDPDIDAAFVFGGACAGDGAEAEACGEVDDGDEDDECEEVGEPPPPADEERGAQRGGVGGHGSG